MEPFDWERLMMGENTSWIFLLEVAFRTLIMYLVMLSFFRITGKKELKQLSVFELIVIIGLGSAAGDPMFYQDVPILHALVTFAIILLLYLFMNYLTGRNHKLAVWLQGDTYCIFTGNILNCKILEEVGINKEELFSELRLKSVKHLGQVERIYIEFSGEFSIYFREKEDVIYGLPILPEELKLATETLDSEGIYSCMNCAYTKEFTETGIKPVCKNCQEKKWKKAINAIRIT